MAFLFYVVFEVHESVSRIFLVLPITSPGNIEFPFIFLAIYFYLCLESPCFQGILTSKLILAEQGLTAFLSFLQCSFALPRFPC